MADFKFPDLPPNVQRDRLLLAAHAPVAVLAGPAGLGERPPTVREAARLAVAWADEVLAQLGSRPPADAFVRCKCGANVGARALRDANGKCPQCGVQVIPARGGE